MLFTPKAYNKEIKVKFKTSTTTSNCSLKVAFEISGQRIT